MKNQALFSSKDKSKKLKCRLLQFLFGALRANFVTDFSIFEDAVTVIDKRLISWSYADLDILKIEEQETWM